MAHQRIRYIESPLKKIMGLSPLVGILGHRQVGKTTLLERVCEKYYVLDADAELKEAANNPDKYIADRAGNWVALDECQLQPKLFPALKEWVRTHKRPGQFILSGSVRFTSREAIRESLTGRIMNLELLPFSLAELEGEPLPRFCFEALGKNDFKSLLHQLPYQKSKVKRSHSQMHKYFSQGGLPGICFIRDAKLREQKIEEQLRTILDRDLRMVQKILVTYTDLRRLLGALAESQFEPVDYTQLKSQVGLATPTIKKVLYALEAVFLIRMVPIEGSSKGVSIFFEDQGEGSTVRQTEMSLTENLLHFAFSNMRHQFQYRLGENVRHFQYRTRGGALVPLCFQGKQGALGIIPLHSAEEWDRATGSANSFLSAYPNSKVILVHSQEMAPRLVKPNLLLAPMAYLV
jgi:predicted AAA+ superfamily ATPase